MPFLLYLENLRNFLIYAFYVSFMSIFIHSYDHTTGTSSNGTWELGQSLIGNFRVTSQCMDTQTYPWLWSGQNQMVVKSFNPEDIEEFVIFGITFNASLGLVSDLTEVATQIQNTMQAAFDLQGLSNIWANRTITVTYNATTQTLLFEIDDDPIDVLWTYNSGLTVSTINFSFNLAPDVSDLINVDIFSISTVNMVTDPKFLEVYIEESPTQYINTHGTYPTLLFSTRDGEFTGQTFEIRTETTELNIRVCKMGSTEDYPLSGQWYLVITPF